MSFDAEDGDNLFMILSFPAAVDSVKHKQQQ